MQRSGSSSSTPMWISSHPPAGGTRAPVAHAWAHGMSVHTTHAWMAGSMIGVPAARPAPGGALMRSEEHTSELQSRLHLVCRLLLEKKKKKERTRTLTHTRTCFPQPFLELTRTGGCPRRLVHRTLSAAI